MYFVEGLFLFAFAGFVSAQGNCADPASASCLSEAQYLIQNCGVPSSQNSNVWAKCACPNIYPLVTDCIKPDRCPDAGSLLEYKPQIESICKSVFDTLVTTTYSATVSTITSTSSTNVASPGITSVSAKSDQASAKNFHAFIAVAMINLLIL